MEIIDPHIEKYFEQIGINTNEPAFCWKLRSEKNGDKQIAYRITVAKEIADLEKKTNLCFDTGIVYSNATSGISYQGEELTALTAYFWQVEIIDGTDVSFKSSIKKFITAKLGEPWQADWIGDGTDKPLYLRKKITIKNTISSAYAIVSGLGHFLFYVNGQKVSNHELDPGWTNYDKAIQYVTFEITDHLKKGENSLNIELANGFYCGEGGGRYFGFESTELNKNYGYLRFADALCGIAEIHILYTDGTKQIIPTNDSWKTKKSALKLANIHGSEVFDAREFDKNWTSAGFNDSNWDPAKKLAEKDKPKGLLVSQSQPPVVSKKSVTPVDSFIIDEQSIVFDFGQNMSGMIELTVAGKKGATIDLYFSEKKNENNDIDPYAEYNGAKTFVNSYCSYILAGSEEENWKQNFSYFGGRYVKVTGISTSSADNLPKLLAVKIDYITSASKQTGTFYTDNKKINAVYDLVIHSIDSNLKSVHTDCPTLEKSAWLETSHLLAPSIMYYKDVRALWNKIFCDIRSCQYQEGDFERFGDALLDYKAAGFIPSRAPYYSVVVANTPVGDFWDALAWGSTIILGVDWYYQYYNDLSVIEENYQSGAAYVQYLLTKINNEGFSDNGLGDWGNPNDLLLAHANVNTAFLYKDIKTLEKFARLLHKTKDAEMYSNQAEKILQNYNSKLLKYDEKSKLWCYNAHPISDEHKQFLQTCGIKLNEKVSLITVACQALPLCFDMVPKEKMTDVRSALLLALKKDGFMVGEITLPFLLRQLSIMNEDKIIVDFMLNDQHPSYYRFIEKGETTLPEFWNDQARSRNHDMMGHIVEWMYGGIAGIKNDSASFKKILIQPFMPKNTSLIHCTYHSIQGKIEIHVQETAEKIELTVEIPVNSEGILDISKLTTNYSGVIINDQKYNMENKNMFFESGIYKVTVFK